MKEKRFQVVFTGEIISRLDRETVIGNIVLTTELTHDRAEHLLSGSEVVLKRFERLADAQLLALKFEKAGAICKVVDRARSYIKEVPRKGVAAGSISTLSRLISSVKSKKSTLRKTAT